MLFGIKMSEHTILDCYVVGNHVRVRVRVFVSVFQYSVSVIQVLIVRLLLVELSKSRDVPHVCWR